jgi:hypothetical protein
MSLCYRLLSEKIIFLRKNYFKEVFFVKEFFEEDEESPDMELKICHLYPDVLNLYGDRGNIRSCI